MAKNIVNAVGSGDARQHGEAACVKRRKAWSAAAALFLVIVLVLCSVNSSLTVVWGSEGTGAAKPAAVTSADEDMRGVWVATVANIDFPSRDNLTSEEMKAEIDQIVYDTAQMGMNAIFFQVRPCADAFYKSEIFPWSMYLTGTQGQAPDSGFDPLEYFIQAAHEKGMELHAWINPYRIATSWYAWSRVSDSNPAKSTHADCVVAYDGGYYFDPANPGSRQLIEEGVAEIVKNYDVDGIHLDDYFYPGSDFEDDWMFENWNNGFATKRAWRMNNVDTLIKELHDTVKGIDPSCDFGISPRGIWANDSEEPEGSATRGGGSYTELYADSRGWVLKGWVDYIAPQIYWNIGFRIADYQILANWWSDVVKDTDVKLYVGIADSRAGSTDPSSIWYGADELSRQMALNDTLPEIDGEIHFSYKDVAGRAVIADFYKYYYNGPLNAEPIVPGAAEEQLDGSENIVPEEDQLDNTAE